MCQSHPIISYWSGGNMLQKERADIHFQGLSTSLCSVCPVLGTLGYL